MDDIRDTALNLLDVPMIEDQAGAVEIVSTILGPREPDEAMRVSLGRVLAERARAQFEGTPAGVAEAKVDHSDHADCPDLDGNQVNAFIAGERCYRLILLVVMRET